MRKPHYPFGLVALAFTLTLGSSLPALAQSTASTPVVSVVLSAAKPDTFMTLVAERDKGDIDRDRDAAKNDESAAELAIRAANEREASEKAEVDLQKANVEQIKAEISLADQNKDEAAKKAGEAKKQYAELRLKLLEKRRDMRSAERGLAQAMKEAAAAIASACERERNLVEKRGENPPFSATDASALAKRLRWENDVRDLEKRTLEAYRDASSKRKSLTERESDVISKRLDVLAVQREIIEQASK